MKKDKHKHPHAESHAESQADGSADPVEAPPPPPQGGATTGGALVEPAPEAVVRLEAELGEARIQLAQTADKYLRAAAEFDNYKKRTARDVTELRARAQAEVIERLVDGLDDLARFAHVDPAQTDAKTMHDGIDMVERKIWKALEAMGVERVDRTGVPFDPNQHEAVTMQPAAQPDQDHTVGAILQPGYRMRNALIRPARVVVLAWQSGSGDGTVSSPERS